MSLTTSPSIQANALPASFFFFRSAMNNAFGTQHTTIPNTDDSVALPSDFSSNSHHASAATNDTTICTIITFVSLIHDVMPSLESKIWLDAIFVSEILLLFVCNDLQGSFGTTLGLYFTIFS